MHDDYENKSRTEKKRKDRIEKSCKVNRDDKNPCMKEQEMSYKCLYDNDYDRDKCSKHFQNYRNCKDFWSTVVKERKRNNIQPHLPGAEEREEIKKEYAKHWQGV